MNKINKKIHNAGDREMKQEHEWTSQEVKELAAKFEEDGYLNTVEMLMRQVDILKKLEALK